jgi:hypothetical protein
MLFTKIRSLSIHDDKQFSVDAYCCAGEAVTSLGHQGNAGKWGLLLVDPNKETSLSVQRPGAGTAPAAARALYSFRRRSSVGFDKHHAHAHISVCRINVLFGQTHTHTYVYAYMYVYMWFCEMRRR